MKIDKFKPYFYVFGFLAFIIWAVQLYCSGTELNISWETAKIIPSAIGIDIFIFCLFAQWFWKLPVFKGWLVKTPIISGTWHGQLQSTWQDPHSAKTIPPIQIQLVIRQNFFTTSCTLMTPESESHSFLADFMIDEERGIKQLIYSYTNTPNATFRYRSEIHYGTALLNIIGTPPSELLGEYWTSRGTTGSMSLKLVTSDYSEKFIPDPGFSNSS